MAEIEYASAVVPAGEFSIPEKRIADANKSRTLFRKQRKASASRREIWARIQNQLDGAAPFSNIELVNAGQGWRCNVNFRDAASTLEQVLVGYWRLLHDTTNLAAVTSHEEDPNNDRFEALFQDGFNRFIEDWGAEYVRNFLLLSQNHVGFGVGLGHFINRESPRWRPVRMGDIEVPEETENRPDGIEILWLRQKMTLSELYEKIRGKTAASAAQAGWNVSAIKKLLTRAIVNGTANRALTESDFVEMADRMRNNSYVLANEYGPVRIVHQIVREFDGKYSLYIFTEDDLVTGDDDNFIFDDSGSSARPESLCEVLAMIFFEAGNGQFWGTKGFGVKNFPLATVMNRLKSRAVDRTLLDGLNFRDMSDGARATVPITNIGPYNFFPKDVEQIQSYPNGRHVIETIELLDQQFNSNNARYRDQARQVEQSNTATQANILTNIQSQVDIANGTLYLKQMAQSLFKEQFRRLRKRGSMDDDAKLFKKRCVEQGGMDEKFFHDAEVTVMTGADPGAANLGLQAESALQVMSLPDGNKRWAQERFVAAKFGAQAVRKALLPVDATSDLKSIRLARLENDAMGHGTPIPVDPQDNHAAHAPEHLQPLQAMADRYKQSGKIQPDALIALQFVLPHLEQHFQYLKQDKTQEALYKQLWPVFTQVASMAHAIFSQLQKVHEAATQQGQNDPAGGFSPSALIGAATPQGAQGATSQN